MLSLKLEFKIFRVTTDQEHYQWNNIIECLIPQVLPFIPTTTKMAMSQLGASKYSRFDIRAEIPDFWNLLWAQ